MNAGKIFLASLLGGTKGGSDAYLNEDSKQREYALKKLEIDKDPSDIESLKAIYPEWNDMAPASKQAAYLNAKSATSSGVQYTDPMTGGAPEKVVTTPPPPPSSTEKIAVAKGKVKAYSDWLNGKKDLDGNTLTAPRAGKMPSVPSEEETNLARGGK